MLVNGSPVSCTFGESSVNAGLIFLQLVILTNEAFDKCEQVGKCVVVVMCGKAILHLCDFFVCVFCRPLDAGALM